MKTLPVIGTVYLLHFSAAYKHARHYIGWTTNLNERMASHRNGGGARLISVITSAGLTFEVARVWEEKTRAFERLLKKRGGAVRWCPICTKKERNGTNDTQE